MIVGRLRCAIARRPSTTPEIQSGAGHGTERSRSIRDRGIGSEVAPEEGNASPPDKAGLT